MQYSYDSIDRLTGEKTLNSAGETVCELTYSYDAAGNRTEKVISAGTTNSQITVNYELGTGNRLAGWSVAETDLVGQVDVVGNANETIGTDPKFGELWVSNATYGAMTPYVAGTNFYALNLMVGLGTQQVVAAIRDEAGNMGYATNTFVLAVVTNGTYSYNAAGCVTNIRYRGAEYEQSISLAWDGQYRLTSVSTNGAVAEGYTYDAFGRRVSIASGETTNYLVYDGPHVIAEVDSGGSLTRSYVYGPSSTGSEQAGIDNLLAMTMYGASTSTYYYLKDHLGSVLALTDEDGEIVEQYQYDGWGRTTVYDGNGQPLAASAVGNRYS